eukprot:6459900-Amphidinium_carterae.1
MCRCWKVFALLGDRRRLSAYMQEAKKSENRQFVCCNVKQNPTHFLVGQSMPALTTASTLIFGMTLSNLSLSEGELGEADSEVADENIGIYGDRVLLGYEHFGVQGFPVLLPAKHELTRYLPKFAHLLKNKNALTDESLRKLAGNTMHVAIVSLALAWCLLCYEPIAEERAAKRKRDS